MTADSKARVFRIFLSELQSQQFLAVLAEAKERTNVTGVFASVRSVFDLENGRMGVELQIGRLSKRATKQIQRILAEDQREAAEQRSDSPAAPQPEPLVETLLHSSKASGVEW